MSKKFFSILLCLIMLIVPVLTSCGAGDEAETGDEADAVVTEDRDPMTLSFWLPTDESTTQEAIEQVEAEINILLASKYNTNIELNAIPADKYDAMVEDKLTDIDKVKTEALEAAESERLQKIEDAENGIIREDKDDDKAEAVTGDETSENTAETILDEYGQPITVFPAVDNDQLDIFLVKGYDKFNEYREANLLTNLDEAMSAVGYKVYSYIYPSFFDLSRVNGSVYAIPNNHALGEYQLLLVNKELVEQYDYSPDELTTLLDCEDFIVDIANQKLPGVTPLLGQCEAPNMVYFSSNNSWSIFGAQITKGVDVYSELAPKIVLGTDFTKIYGMMKRLNSKGVVGDGVIDEGEKFAVGVVKGDASLFDKYAEDYYVHIHGVPVADVDDVFESVYCISKYTKDSTRAMEVLTYLNTDETFRTLLQYGVQGVHWREDVSGDEKVIKIIDDSYKMNILDTGNVYLTYPGEGIGKSYWDYSMKQNLDSAANPYVGFEYINDDNKKIFMQLANFSATCLKDLENASPEEFDALVSKTINSFMQNNTFKLFFINETPEGDVKETFTNIYTLYHKTKR